MNNATQTKREIARKEARTAHLKEFVSDNKPLAFKNVEAGFFASAAELFGEIAGKCEELYRLGQDLQQLRLDLERIQSEQTELHLCGSASGAVLNSPHAA